MPVHERTSLVEPEIRSQQSAGTEQARLTGFSLYAITSMDPLVRVAGRLKSARGLHGHSLASKNAS